MAVVGTATSALRMNHEIADQDMADRVSLGLQRFDRSSMHSFIDRTIRSYHAYTLSSPSISPPPVTSTTRIHHPRNIYLSFFFGLNWLVCPHFFFRQLVARGGRRAYSVEVSIQWLF